MAASGKPTGYRYPDVNSAHHGEPERYSKIIAASDSVYVLRFINSEVGRSACLHSDGAFDPDRLQVSRPWRRSHTPSHVITLAEHMPLESPSPKY